jgi:hypothetical protein
MAGSVLGAAGVGGRLEWTLTVDRAEMVEVKGAAAELGSRDWSWDWSRGCGMLEISSVGSLSGRDRAQLVIIEIERSCFNPKRGRFLWRNSFNHSIR